MATVPLSFPFYSPVVHQNPLITESEDGWNHKAALHWVAIKELNLNYHDACINIYIYTH